MNIRVANLIVGYIFLGLGLLGCLAVATQLLGINFFGRNNYVVIFLPSSSGGVSSAAMFMSVVTIVGAYLVKK